MISSQKLKAVTSIVVHDNCPDGLMSAIILKDVLPDASVQFAQYGESEEGLVAEPHMLFCDFSPHRARLQAFLDVGAIVLDHHKTAREVVEQFGLDGVFADEAREPGVCGASLAYREVWRQLSPVGGTSFLEGLVRRAGIRDTWQRNHPDWYAACAQAEALMFHAIETWFVPDTFGPTNQHWWESRLSIGPRLIEKHHEKVLAATERAYRYCTSHGKRVCMFSGLRLVSDAAEYLGDAEDLVVAFDYAGHEPDGRVRLVYSLRSHTGFDCGEFCKNFGGGGHTAAAGFTVWFLPGNGASDPFSMFAEFLADWEEITQP